MAAMNRRVRKRLRDEAMEYARRFLGVKRLPPGVPGLVRNYINGLTGWPEPGDDTLAHLLRPYRKPWTGL